MAFDPGRTRRLAPCLSAIPPLGGVAQGSTRASEWNGNGGGQRGVGQDHGPSGGAGGTAAGTGLRGRHHHARASEGVRCAPWQRPALSLRFIRKIADRCEALGRSRGGLGTKVVGVCDAAGRLLDFLLVPGQAHELAPSLDLNTAFRKARAFQRATRTYVALSTTDGENWWEGSALGGVAQVLRQGYAGRLEQAAYDAGRWRA